MKRQRIALLGGGGEMMQRVCGDRGVGNPTEKDDKIKNKLKENHTI